MARYNRNYNKSLYSKARSFLHFTQSFNIGIEAEATKFQDQISLDLEASFEEQLIDGNEELNLMDESIKTDLPSSEEGAKATFEDHFIAEVSQENEFQFFTSDTQFGQDEIIKGSEMSDEFKTEELSHSSSFEDFESQDVQGNIKDQNTETHSGKEQNLAIIKKRLRLDTLQEEGSDTSIENDYVKTIASELSEDAHITKQQEIQEEGSWQLDPGP